MWAVRTAAVNSFYLWARADSYYEGGLVCLESKHAARRNVDGSPTFYLFCHAIELVLKAYLLKNGMQLKELAGRSYGHDLIALLSRAKKEGIYRYSPTSKRIWPNIAVLNRAYHAKDFEYPADGFRKVVDTRELCEQTYMLLLELKGVCGVSRPRCPTRPARAH